MLDKLLRYVYRLVRYRAYWIIGVFLVLGALSLFYIFPFPIRSSLLDLLPQDDPLINEYRERESTINSTQYLTVVLSYEGEEDLGKEEKKRQLIELARVIKPLLEEVPEIGSVNYRGEGAIPERYEFLYSLNESTISGLAQFETDLAEFFESFPAEGLPEGPGNLYGDLAEELQNLESGDSLTEAKLSKILAELESRNQFTLAALESEERLEEFDHQLRSLRKRFREVRNQREDRLKGEYLSDDGSTLLIKAESLRPGSHDIKFSRKLTSSARDAVAQAKKSEVFQSGDYGIDLTGTFVINSQRNSALKVDMFTTTIVSSVAVVIAFFFALGSLFYSILIVFPLAIAVLLMLSWAKFSVGGFNLLTTFLPALVLGLSIDYGIHLLFRFNEERTSHLTVSKAAEVTIMKKGKGIFIAALTTSAVFTTLIFSRSQGLVEMGIITSLGIIISFLVYIFLLPALIVSSQRWQGRRQSVELFDYRSTLKGLVKKSIKYKKTVLGVSLAISLLALLGAFQLDFQVSDDDVSAEVKGVRVQERIQEKFESSDMSIGPSFAFFSEGMEGVKDLEGKLGGMDSVKSINSIRDYLPDDVDKVKESAAGVEKIKKLDDGLSSLEGFLNNKEDKIERLESLIGDLSSAQLSSTLSSQSGITVQLNRVIDQLLDIRSRLSKMDEEATRQTVVSLRDQLNYLEESIAPLADLISNGEEGLIKALPKEVLSTFTTERGEYVTFAETDKSIYESEELNSFVGRVSEFTDDFFGMPLIHYRLEGHIRHDFVISTALAIVLIGLILYRGINSWRLSLLAVIPLVLGYLWMLGGMRVFGMNFNFINIIISPLLIGIGVDDGLHLIYRWREDRVEGEVEGSILSAFSHTGLAVVTTSITTIAVFGSLFIASTPGLRMLGGTALLGIGFAMILSLTVLPAGLYLAFSRNEK
ncbi:MMPL family transporter [Candidatus Bipolaricaulota bacterium]|nr:MMPL family transporter [Candidatus Bipolaricaulota bacterium]